MARLLESLRRQPAPTPSGEVTPHRDRVRGTKGRVLATAATLLLAVPGVALATMGNTGEGPNGGQHSSSVVRYGEGQIHPAGQLDWCLAGRAQPDGRPPGENSVVEVRPCAADNPFQQWNVIIDETPGEPDKMIAQLHGLNLCLATQLSRPSDEAVPARLANCNDPLSTHQPRELEGYWEIADVNAPKDEPQVLSVPARLKREKPYQIAIWIDFNLARGAENENTLFVLPELHAGNGNTKVMANFN